MQSVLQRSGRVVWLGPGVVITILNDPCDRNAHPTMDQMDVNTFLGFLVKGEASLMNTHGFPADPRMGIRIAHALGLLEIAGGEAPPPPRECGNTLIPDMSTCEKAVPPMTAWEAWGMCVCVTG